MAAIRTIRTGILTTALLATGTLGLTPARADAPERELFELGGQIRLRGEIDARDFDNRTDPDGVVSSRVRLDVTARPSKSVSAFVQLQDVRVYGEEGNTLTDPDADGFDLHQGYLGITDLVGSGIDLRAGRQEVNLGEQRLVGAVDWTQNARSFDGLRLDAHVGESVTVTPFGFVLDERDAIAAGGALRQANPLLDEGKDDDTYFLGAHSVIDVARALIAEPHVYLLRAGASGLERWTLGAYGHGAVELDGDLALLWNATFDFQTGDLDDDTDIEATLFAGHVGLELPVATVTVGYDRLSGDDDPSSGTSQSFDTMFATNHKFYGHMDYFLSVGDTAGLGLQDLVLRASAPLGDETQLGAELHAFWTAERDRRAGVAPEERLLEGENDLGREVDLWIAHRLEGVLGLRLGYSFFVPGDAIRARFRAIDRAAEREPRPHGAVAHWAYLMADLRF